MSTAGPKKRDMAEEVVVVVDVDEGLLVEEETRERWFVSEGEICAGRAGTETRARM